MSDSANDAADRLARRYEAEAAKYRRRANDLKAKLTELEASVQTLTTERDQARNQFADAGKEIDALKAAVQSAPGDAAAEVERLKGELRTRDHRAAFDRLSAGKLRPEALEAAWKLSGYAPDADDVDEAKLTEAIDSVLKANAFLAPDGAESGGAATPSQSGRLQNGQSSAPAERPPGTGRGAAPNSASATTAPAVFRLA